MNITEFKDYVISLCPNATFEEKEVAKNNEILHGIIVRTGTTTSPVFYKENLDMYDKKTIKEALEHKPFEADDIINSPVTAYAVNKENNKKMLENCAYDTVCDLAIVKRAILDDGKSSTLLPTGSDKELMPYTFSYIEKLLNSFLTGEKRFDDVLDCTELNTDDMFVVSNKYGMYGSGAIADTEYLKKIHKRLGDFYILPSSIHELIIIKEQGNIDDLKQMVIEINSTEVKPEEKLSDNVYIFRGNKVEIG